MTPYAIKLRKAQCKDILAATFPGYTGRKFAVEFTEKVCFYNTNWSGGSKNTYAAISSNGRTATLNVTTAPWDNPIEGATVELPLHVLIVKHCIFCGKDLGITIYAHPCHLPKWITA